MNLRTKYAKWRNTLNATQPTTPTLQIGVVYWGDTGNANMVVGLLLSCNDGWAIIRDILGTEHRVIKSTLKSAQ